MGEVGVVIPNTGGFVDASGGEYILIWWRAGDDPLCCLYNVLESSAVRDVAIPVLPVMHLTRTFSVEPL